MSKTNPMNETLKTLVSQLGGARSLVTLVAKTVVYSNDKNELLIRLFKSSNKITNVVIRYNAATDLYDIDYWYCTMAKQIKRASDEGIYNDMLIGVLENRTGLCWKF